MAGGLKDLDDAFAAASVAFQPSMGPPPTPKLKDPKTPLKNSRLPSRNSKLSSRSSKQLPTDQECLNRFNQFQLLLPDIPHSMFTVLYYQMSPNQFLGQTEIAIGFNNKKASGYHLKKLPSAGSVLEQFTVDVVYRIKTDKAIKKQMIRSENWLRKGIFVRFEKLHSTIGKKYMADIPVKDERQFEDVVRMIVERRAKGRDGDVLVMKFTKMK